MSSYYGPSPAKVIGVIVAVVLAIVLIGSLIGVTFHSTPADEAAVCTGGGPFDSRGVKSEMGPDSGNQFVGVWDNCYDYPVSLRTYRAGTGDNADGDAIVAPSQDGVQMRYEVSVRFNLNTTELRAFHEEVGNRYDAYSDEGWERMLDVVFRGELDTTIQRVSRHYTAVDLAFNADILAEVEQEIQDGLRTQINESVEGEFFCGPGHEYGSSECPEMQASLTVIEPHAEATRTAFESVQVEAAETRAATQAIETEQAFAEATRIAQEALSDGNAEAYVLLEAIRSGDIDFWVIPSDAAGSLTLPAPAAQE